MRSPSPSSLAIRTAAAHPIYTISLGGSDFSEFLRCTRVCMHTLKFVLSLHMYNIFEPWVRNLYCPRHDGSMVFGHLNPSKEHGTNCFLAIDAR